MNKDKSTFKLLTTSDLGSKEQQKRFIEYPYHVAIVYNVQEMDWFFSRLGNTDFNLYISKEKNEFFVSILPLREILVRNPKNGRLYRNVNKNMAQVSKYLFRETVLTTYTQSKTKHPCFLGKSCLMPFKEFMAQIALKIENTEGSSSFDLWNSFYDYLKSVTQKIKTMIPQELTGCQSSLFSLENAKKSDNCFLELSDLKKENSDLRKANSELRKENSDLKKRLTTVQDALKA